MDRDDLGVRLWEAAGARRADRRSYEWKVTLGLWAGLLAVAKLAIDSRALSQTDHHTVVSLVSCVLLLLVVAGHALYEFAFIIPANHHDLTEALAIENELRQVAKLPAAQPSGQGRPWRYGPAIFQVGVTWLLAAVAAGSIIISKG